jgi:hypothetical protein
MHSRSEYRRRLLAAVGTTDTYDLFGRLEFFLPLTLVRVFDPLGLVFRREDFNVLAASVCFPFFFIFLL